MGTSNAMILVPLFDLSGRAELAASAVAAFSEVSVALNEALAASGVPASVSADIVALTLSLVRGLALRTLWDNDPKWFDELFAVWRRMIKIFLESQHPKARAR